MARKAANYEQAPAHFISASASGTETRRYEINLLTPMAGGGTQSWQPDLDNPVRSQEIKGHLRFWWRAMQHSNNPKSLKKREDALWGSTDYASRVRLRIRLLDEVTKDKNFVDIHENDKGTLQFENLPGYVLFPFQGKKKLPVCRLLKDLRFELSLRISGGFLAEVENSVKLWLLFGGLGARTCRGCGSLYCEEVMRKFTDGAALGRFLHSLSPSESPAFSCSPYPVIGNSRLSCSEIERTNDPRSAWTNFLSSYGNFRQGAGIGRNKGRGNRPGRTRWPEADAIRRLTGNASPGHEPEHPAGNWFPRGAYGLPIQTGFKNAKGDPDGKFFLQPEGRKRWPSPVILKIIKLNAERLLKVCLLLNQSVPDNLELKRGSERIHTLEHSEHPLSFQGKTMPAKADMLHSGESPYDALIRHLNLTEVQS